MSLSTMRTRNSRGPCSYYHQIERPIPVSQEKHKGPSNDLAVGKRPRPLHKVERLARPQGKEPNEAK